MISDEFFKILKLSFNISRFRFWTYIGGTYLVGYTIAAASSASNLSSFSNISFYAYLFYFLIIANILLYGINDYYDYDTDVLNKKKSSKEYLAKNSERKNIFNIVFFCILSSSALIVYNFILGKLILGVILSAFLFLSVFYSAKPLRFKSRPILDFSSNFLYILPGVFGYAQFSGELPGSLVLIALFFWTCAMHLYSAVPDIIPDSKAKIKTSAVLLGHNYSLILCTLFWALFSAILFYAKINIYLWMISLIYPVLSLATLLSPKKSIHKIYWYYPYINSAAGFAVFLFYFSKILF